MSVRKGHQAMTEIETAKKIADISKKTDRAKRELKTKKEILIRDIENNHDTTSSSIDVKYAARKLESLQKELDRLK